MKIDKSFLGIIALLIVIGALSVGLYFRNEDETDRAVILNFPLQIGEWQGENIGLTEREFAVLETRNAILRKYKNSKGEPVFLYIIVSEKNRKTAHPPEICYIGSGAKILEKDVFSFDVTGLEDRFEVNSFVSRDKGDSLVFYWYKSGNNFTANYLKQQTKVVLNKLMGKSSPIAMIRVSTPIAIDKEHSSELLQEFTKRAIPVIIKYTP